MDLDAFQQMLDAPNRSQQDLLVILANARRKNAFHQKVEVLERLAAVPSLKMGVDWDWNGRGLASDRLDADALLQELGGLTSATDRGLDQDSVVH